MHKAVALVWVLLGVVVGYQRCPIRTSSLRSPAEDGKPINVFVVNQAKLPINLFWISPKWEEVLLGQIPYGDGISAIIRAKQDHSYRARWLNDTMLVEFTAHTHNMNVPVAACVPTPALTEFVEVYLGPSHTTGVAFELNVNTPVGSLLNKPKSDDTELQLNCTLSQLAVGRNETITIFRSAKCPLCGGHGALPDHRQPCTTCNGTGGLKHDHVYDNCHSHPLHPHEDEEGDDDHYCDIPSLEQKLVYNCPHCEGWGTIPLEPCPQCLGRRFVMVNTTLNLVIPPGADTQYSIRLPGMGNEVPFKIPGDAKIVVNALPDGQYQRNGSDLTLHVDLSLKEALLGWNRTLTHPNGTKFGIIYDRMSSPDVEIRFLGRGMPVLQSSDQVAANESLQYGDLLIAPRVSLLSSLSKEVEERLASLVDEGNGNVKRKKVAAAIVANNTDICEDARCQVSTPSPVSEGLTKLAASQTDDIEDLDG